jgi:hypothetical protein
MLVAMLAMLQGTVTPAAPLHYRIESRTTSDQDLTSIGRGKVSGGLATTAWVAVTMSDSADGQIARITVDSLTLAPAGAMAAQLSQAAATLAADSARGAWVQVYSVHGLIRGTPRPSSQNPALGAIMQAVGVFFPGLRTNVKVGDKWADTTKIDTDVQSGHEVGNIIANWSVVREENAGLVLDGAVITKMLTTNQDGRKVNVSITSRQHMVMGSRGAPTRDATIESASDVTMTSPQSAAPIPARNSGSLTLTLLP